MANIVKFAEAAILYAKNIEIVNEMEKIYYQEINNFFDKIETVTIPLVAPLHFRRSETDGARCWWLEKEKGKDEHLSYFWVKKSPEILCSGKLDLVAYVDEGYTEGLAFLRENIEKSEYAEFRRPASDLTKYNTEHLIANIEIEYGEEIDIDKIAQTVFNILSYLREKHIAFNNKSKKL